MVLRICTCVALVLSLSLEGFNSFPMRDPHSGMPSPFFMCPAMECFMTEMFLPCDYRDRYISTIRGLTGMECPGCPACRDENYLSYLIGRHAHNVDRLQERNANFSPAVAALQEALSKLKMALRSAPDTDTESDNTPDMNVEIIVTALGEILKEQRAKQMESFLQSLKKNVADVQALTSGNFDLIKRTNAADIRPNGEYFTLVFNAYNDHLRTMFPGAPEGREPRGEAYEALSISDICAEIELLLSVVSDVREITEAGKEVVKNLQVNAHTYFTSLRDNPTMLRVLFYSLEENDNILLQAFTFWGEPYQIDGLNAMANYLIKLYYTLPGASLQDLPESDMSTSTAEGSTSTGTTSNRWSSTGTETTGTDTDLTTDRSSVTQSTTSNERNGLVNREEGKSNSKEVTTDTNTHTQDILSSSEDEGNHPNSRSNEQEDDDNDSDEEMNQGQGAQSSEEGNSGQGNDCTEETEVTHDESNTTPAIDESSPRDPARDNQQDLSTSSSQGNTQNTTAEP